MSMSQSTTTASSSALSQDRFHNILTVPKSRLVKHMMFDFISFINNASNPIPIVVFIINIWRTIQFIEPALFSGSRKLYPEDTAEIFVISIFSFFNRIVPTSVKSDFFIPYSIVILCCFYILLVIVGITIYYFTKFGKISKILAQSLSFIFDNICILFVPISYEHIGFQIGKNFIQDENLKDAASWVLIILLLITSFILYFLYFNFTSVSLTYKITTFGAFDHKLQTSIVLFTSLAALISGVTPYIPDSGRHIFYIIMLLIYVSAFIFSILAGGFTQQVWNAVFSSACITGVITTGCSWVFDSIGKKFFIFALFILIFIFFILTGISRMVDTKITFSMVEKLDLWLASRQDLIDDPPGQIKAFFIAARGFAFGHPFILSWDFLQVMTNLYPKSARLWILFARFTSAFPDDTLKLLWVSGEIKKLKTHSKYVGHLRAQITFLTRTRESSMTHELKKRINSVQKEIQASRNRLRHFWECVIQGNTDDMEIASSMARKTVSKTESDINHLLRSYPNNQYVARIYSRFLINIKGDKLAYSEWHQNVEKLKNGQTIEADYAQQCTLQLFPLILNTTVQQQSVDVIGGCFGESTSMLSISSSSCHFVDDNEEQNNLLLTIKNSVTNMSVPSIKMSILFIVLITIIICCLYFPIVALSFLIDSQSTFDRISIISDESALKTCLFHMASLALQHVYGLIGTVPNVEDIIGGKQWVDAKMTSMNDLSDNANILEFIVEDSKKYLERIRGLNNIASESGALKSAQEYMFSNVLNTKTYIIMNGRELENYYPLSAETLTIAIGLDCETALGLQTSDEAIAYLSTTGLSNIMSYLNSSMQGISTSIKYLEDDVANKQTNINHSMDIVSYVAIAVIIVVFIACIVYIIIEVNYDKKIAAKAFLTIPKHVISKLVDSLKMSSGKRDFEEEDEDERNEIQRNKQEENFIAMLATTSSASKLMMRPSTIAAFSMFVLLVITLVMVMVSSNTIKSSNEIIRLSSPHANYFLSMYSNLVGCYNKVLQVIFEDTNHHIIGSVRDVLVEEMIAYLVEAKVIYSSARFGSTELNIKPLSYINEAVSDESFTPGDMAQLSFENINVLSPDDLYSIVSNQLARQIVMAIASSTSKLVYDSSVLGAWYVLFFQLFDKFYSPNSDSLLDIVKDAYNTSFTTSMFYAGAFIVVSIIIAAFAIYQLHNVSRTTKWMISTLMMIQPDVLLASRPICSILQGEFKETNNKMNVDKNTNFYDTLIDLFVDSVMIVQPDLTITNANPATARIFNVNHENVIGKKLPELLNPDKTCVECNKFLGTLREALLGEVSLKINRMIEYKNPDDGSISYLNVNITAFSKKGAVQSLSDARGKLKCLNVVCRDISQLVRSENLLKEERKRSDSLLRHVLPPKIVDSLQAGEKDVSFAVSSASISFMDIVSFTPWCAANTAQVVCSTLNRLFKEYDLLLAQHPTLTKVKCIGDCYMAAGGIFDNPNDPHKHAYEMVHFGCCCIRALRRVDEELNQKLQVRFGINTGGPIVAGVLGVGRPTFEILGPTINMAQQMEQHGVPMKVHISRGVYEMIYDSDLTIHERGEIEVKRGVVTTYLIDPDENP